MFMDVFNTQAFSLVSLTDRVNRIPFVPGFVSSLGLFNETGVPTTDISIEEESGKLRLVPTRPRGAPPMQGTPNKRTIRKMPIPQLPQEDTVTADEVQGVRQFGSENQLASVQSVVDSRFAEMSRNLDATLEYHRLGALRGLILDADGSSVVSNLYDEFGVTAYDTIDFDLDNANPALGALRLKCHEVYRKIEDELDGNMMLPGIMALVGSNFFDKLVTHKEFLAAFNYEATNGIMREPLARRDVTIYGIRFKEYRGKVGNTQFVGDDDAHFFPVGVPGLFRTYYAPGDFLETVNTIGLPRYAKIAPDTKWNRSVSLMLQSNPLSVCLRPRVLIKGTKT
jgi:hypothetical protein